MTDYFAHYLERKVQQKNEEDFIECMLDTFEKNQPYAEGFLREKGAEELLKFETPIYRDMLLAIITSSDRIH